MRHIVVIVWSLIIGQIVAFLGVSLNDGAFSFWQAIAGSLVVAVVVILIGELSQPTKQKIQK